MANADELPGFEPQAWWEPLDVEVADAFATLQREEGMRPGAPDNYPRAGTALQRFVTEYPELEAALLSRYPDPNPEDSVQPGEPYGIGIWMIENMVDDRFPRRDDAPDAQA